MMKRRENRSWTISHPCRKLTTMKWFLRSRLERKSYVTISIRTPKMPWTTFQVLIISLPMENGARSILRSLSIFMTDRLMNLSIYPGCIIRSSSKAHIKLATRSLLRSTAGKEYLQLQVSTRVFLFTISFL